VVSSPAPTGLPVEAVIPEVRAALEGGAAVLQAEPGAGKTTVVPLRLLDTPWLGGQGIVVLEPRRVAARAAAARMAALLGEPVGATVGYATRDDRRVGPSTRIEVVTEGILVRRLQHDPALTGTGLVVFDELHERHLQTDLSLALTLDARAALRPDLRVLAMSATVDTAAVAGLLGGAGVVTSPGRAFPVEVRWAAGPSRRRLGDEVAAAVARALGEVGGDVLAFLPGVGEIRATAAALGDVGGVEVLALHGSLPAHEQDRALRAGDRRRVVLATDLAESSVTVEGVGAVVDAGLARRPAFDPATGLTRLRTTVAARSSADQRAGRAGRLGPGVAYRLWTEGDHAARRPWPDPEVLLVDLAALTLELSLWGATAGDLRWLDPPPAAGLRAAGELLAELRLVEGGRPTAAGRRAAGLPVHPRLGHMLVTAGAGDRRAATLLAALLSERDVLARQADGWAATADVTARLAVLEGRGGAGPVDRAAVATARRRAGQLAARLGPPPATAGAAAGPGPLLAAAYPDRLAQARGGGRFRLRHGGGASLPEHDPLRHAPWIVAADVTGAGTGDGRIRLAAAVDLTDVEQVGGPAVRTATKLVWDADDLRTVTETTLDALVLASSRSPAPPGPEATAALVAHVVEGGLTGLGWTPAAQALRARAAWAHRALGDDWPAVSDEALAAASDAWLVPQLAGATGRRDLDRVDPGVAVDVALGARRRDLDRLVPATLTLAGGRRAPIDWSGDTPRVSARPQELYGTTVHPTVAGGTVPVVVELMSPAGRPIQVTADLPGFWAGTWREVRRDMAGRYPKHVWPDDPAEAAPVSRPRRRR
jgi:ATP-dependent helicase HrpB